MRASGLAVAVAALVLGVRGAAATFEPIYPLVSPDGARIGWVEGSSWQIWTANPDGSGARAVGTPFAGNGVSRIAWTHRGLIVDSNFTLFLVGLDGKRTRLAPDEDFTFSVGGARVASGQSGLSRVSAPLLVTDLRTHRTVRMGVPKAVNLEPSLSPDGKQVVWSARGSLWIAPVGGAPHRLATGGTCPQWSPDGGSIAYLRIPDDALRVIPVDGGRPRTLLTRAGGCDVPGAPEWSPDSSRVATDRDGLTIVDVGTGRTVRIAATTGRVAGGIAWSTDGSSIYASVRSLAAEATGDDCTSLLRLDATTLRGSAVVGGCPQPLLP